MANSITAHAFHAAPAASTAGLLLSLASALPRNAAALRRRATALANRLQAPHSRALDRRASDLLAQLLTATDCAELAGYTEDGCLDSEWDA